MKAKLRLAGGILAIILVAGWLVPERITVPVQGATTLDWNANSFWYEPWGSSGVHKGIDIFAATGTKVVSAVDGLVLYRGHLSKGGNVILVLGPKWRLHYYAHLERIEAGRFTMIRSAEVIGTVGDTGNAKGKPPHLHYSIQSLIPRLWAMDGATQGYKKAIFINPDRFLRGDLIY